MLFPFAGYCKKNDAWWSGVDVWWPLDMTRGYDIGLQIWRWRVQSPAVLWSRRDPRQVVHLPRSIRHAVYTLVCGPRVTV